METVDLQYEESSIGYLRTQQASILAEISNLARAAGWVPSIYRTTSHLQRRYNALVDEIVHSKAISLTDPAQCLPLELWIMTIQHVIEGALCPCDLLLSLTLVSPLWRNCIIFAPTLWNLVTLDEREIDYHPKALVCLNLAQESPFHLKLTIVSPDGWHTISPSIHQASDRLLSLSLNVDHVGRTLPTILLILENLPFLPFLTELTLPQACHVLFNSTDFHRMHLDRMPLLKTLICPSLPSFNGPWSPFVVANIQWLRSVRTDTLKFWTRSNNLKYISVIETSENRHALESLPNSLNPPLPLVRTFQYEGPAPDRSLKWIGHELTTLTLWHLTMGDYYQLFSWLQPFPVLNSLKIDRLLPSGATVSRSNEEPLVALSSVKRFILVKVEAGNNPDFEDDSLGHFHEPLVVALPYLEGIHIGDYFMTQSFVTYIEGLKYLREFTVLRKAVTQNCAYNVTIKGDYLERISIPDQFIAHFLSKSHVASLRVLEVGSKVISPKTIQDSSEERIRLPNYYLSHYAFPNLTTFQISIGIPVSWRLGFHPNLREINFLCPNEPRRRSLMWAGDLLEEILVRPVDTPALDRVALRGDFYEWDILILMLERKNFLAHRGISHIKSMVFEYPPSYHLLNPLSTLLQGKFPDRESNHAYSIDTLGKYIWNKDFKGCMRCCSSFRACETLPVSRGSGKHVREVIPFNWDYEFPLEFLTPDPPLNPEVADWLSKKYQRRKAFVQDFKETSTTLHRITVGAATQVYSRT